MAFILRVDDVGRKPGDSPEIGTDRDLLFFGQWRQKMNLQGVPIYYGAVPTWIDDIPAKWLDSLAPEIASVHGINHERKQSPTIAQLKEARAKFPSLPKSFIPPFNHYSRDTIENWRAAGGEFFFGGFNGEHHNYGQLPDMKGGCLHLPAAKELYGKVYEVTDALEKWQSHQCPLVCTLHVPWDASDNELEEFGVMVNRYNRHGRIWTLERAKQWYNRSRLDRRQLTAPHFLAYQWILDRLIPFETVFDFGSRYSELPALMELRGHPTIAYDRDPRLDRYQEKFRRKYDCEIRTTNTESDSFLETRNITACWAIQHNQKEEIPLIVARLASKLRSGGRLLIVGSYTTGESFWQDERADPQWVLNDKDYHELIVKPSKCKIADFSYFKYIHAEFSGEHCKSDDANAMCLCLVKD